ncbi:MAG TPA: hypothetical protein VKJ83_08605, partial [Actinomycetota bacterium]|nr:hypothetical protein [Actinomycetota bacterium]
MGSERALSIWERLRVAWFIRSGPLQDALAERTGLVFENERASALEERAWGLLDEGLSDERVVLELRKTAGRHRRDLAVAARIVKHGGYAFELSEANRAWRLLEAAATDSPVVKPTAEELARFEVLDELFCLPEAEGFD